MTASVAEAARLFANQDFAGCLEALRPVVDADPGNLAALALLGAALFETKQLMAAEATLSSVLETEPDNSFAWGYFYKAKRRQGKLIDLVRLHLEGKAHLPDEPYFDGEPFAALCLTGDVATALASKDRFKRATEKSQCWLAMAAQALDRPAEAVDLQTAGAALVRSDVMLQRLLLRGLAQVHRDAEKAYDAFVASTGIKNRKVWCHFELARYCDVTTALPGLGVRLEERFNIDPTPYCPKATGLSQALARPDDHGRFVAPVVVRAELVANLHRIMGVVAELNAEGVFDTALANIAAVRAAYGAEAKDPVQMLSTGRCGTLAFYDLMRRSDKVVPYHTIGWQLIPADRNHMLYRILTGRLDKGPLARLLTAYLENRVAEMMAAYGENKTPVIINHWDTVFAPVWAVLFPSSTFLHLYRNDRSVFESFYGKNQFQNEQLHYCRFDQNFPGGRFIFRYEEDRPIEDEIAWYLNITREYALAFMEVVGEARMASVASERLFDRRREDFDTLRRIIPADDLSFDSFCANYSKPINAKPEKAQKPADLGRRTERALRQIDGLSRTGRLDA